MANGINDRVWDHDVQEFIAACQHEKLHDIELGFTAFTETRNHEYGGAWLSTTLPWAIGSKEAKFLALSHLWMAVEALLPLIVEDVCTEESKSLEELAQSKGIDLTDPRRRSLIHGTVRRERVFQGDPATHRRAKLASDGLGRGFAEAGAIKTNAVEVCGKVFRYLRTAIIGHLRIPEPFSTEMGSKEPIDTHSSKKMIRADLRGEVPVDQLAPNGEQYPRSGWTTSIKEVVDEADSFSMTLNENFVRHFGPGVSVENFHLVAMWRPTTQQIESAVEPGPVDNHE